METAVRAEDGETGDAARVGITSQTDVNAQTGVHAQHENGIDAQQETGVNAQRETGVNAQAGNATQEANDVFSRSFSLFTRDAFYPLCTGMHGVGADFAEPYCYVDKEKCLISGLNWRVMFSRLCVDSDIEVRYTIAGSYLFIYCSNIDHRKIRFLVKCSEGARGNKPEDDEIVFRFMLNKRVDALL
jgi:hypothetical protein